MTSWYMPLESIVWHRVYIFVSLFVYGIILVCQFFIRPPPHGQHDWLFLGTYLLSAIFSISLLILKFSTHPPPQNIYDYIHVSTASLRTLLFLSLAVISEIIRIRPISSPDLEAGEALNTNGSPNYGTFDIGPHPESFGGFGSDASRKDGWVKYILSFTVPFPHDESKLRSSFVICGLVKTDICRKL